MANDLVVNLGARLDQFQSDMNQAGDIADGAVGKIESAFSKLNPGINLGTLTTVIAGATAGFTALLALVQTLNKGLDDMAKQAERIGISTERLQQLKFAGAALGVNDVGNGLEEFSKNVENSLSRVNDLKRVFDANNVSITDGNGKVRDMSKLLDSAFDIVRRAPNIGDALQIGSFLGFSKEFSQELFRAGAGFQELATQANAAGAVIDKATIDKASEFTKEWNKASAIWGAQMKASIAEWLPLLNDAIGVAQKLIGFVSQVTSALGAIKDFAIAPDVDTASLSKLQSLNEQFEGIRDTLEKGEKLNPIQLFQASNIQKDGAVTLEAVNQQLALIQDRILNFNKDPKNRVIITGETPSKNPGLKPQGSDTDEFTRAVATIERRTAVQKADTEALGLGAAAQAKYRAEATLLLAAQQAKIPVDEEVAKKIKDTAAAASAAAEAFAKAKVAEDIKFGAGTAFLTPADLQIAQQLRAIYGDDIPAALASSEAAALRFNQALQSVSQTGQEITKGLLVEFGQSIRSGATAMEALEKAGLSALGKIADKLASMAADQLWKAAFGGTSGFGLGSLFGGTGGASAGPITLGGASGPVPFFANGTDFAPGGMAMVGERGPELVNLPRGSQVIPNDMLRQRGGETSSFTFAPSIDARGADVAAVARIEQVLARQQQEFSANVVKTVRMAKTSRML